MVVIIVIIIHTLATPFTTLTASSPYSASPFVRSFVRVCILTTTQRIIIKKRKNEEEEPPPLYAHRIADWRLFHGLFS
jgi:hypothetical protein